MPDYGRYDSEDTRGSRPAGRNPDDRQRYGTYSGAQTRRTSSNTERPFSAHYGRTENARSYDEGYEEIRTDSRRDQYTAARPARTGYQSRYDEEERGASRPVSRSYARYSYAEDGNRRQAASAYNARYGQRPAADSRRQPVREPVRARAAEADYPAERSFSMPRWARLAMFAVIVVALIGGVVGLITALTGREDTQTVMVPGSNGELTIAATEAPVVEPVVDESTEVTEEIPTAEDPLSGWDVTPKEDIEPEIGTQQILATPVMDPFAYSNDVTVPADGSLRRATIRMAGDVIIDKEMLDASYDSVMQYYNFEPYFELIGDTLSRADYTMINIEASLRKGKYGYSGYPQFTTPPIILDVVKAAGADMITMQNNHMLDGYCDGLVESVGLVDKAGLDHIGGYVDEADSNTPEIFEINGIKVGFVTYTHSTNSMENHCDERTKYLVNYFKTSNCKTDIENARAAGAEVIVAVTHWGEEYKRQPESSTRSLAQQLVAAGADIIIGGHPHMVQPVEYVSATDAYGNSRTALCLYSLGNFLSQHRVQYTDSGVVFEFTIQENSDGTFSITNPGYVPVYVWTFKNNEGEDDYRVMPIGNYLNNPPSGMSGEQVNRMTECWNEMLEVMNSDTVAKPLPA